MLENNMEGKKIKAPGNTAPTLGKAAKEKFCSFCYKSSNHTYRIIVRPNNIFICNECIKTLAPELCYMKCALPYSHLWSYSITYLLNTSKQDGVFRLPKQWLDICISRTWSRIIKNLIQSFSLKSSPIAIQNSLNLQR
jgi:hypothetical protein